MPFPAHRVLRRPQATSPAPAQVTRWRGTWLVIGQAEARAALTDPRLRPATPAAPPEQPPPDPARSHVRLRRFTASVVTARHVERVRPRTTSTAKALLDLMANGGEPVDLVAAVARRLAVATACQVLGIPERDRAELRELVEELHAAWRGGDVTDAKPDRAAPDRAAPGRSGPSRADRSRAAPAGEAPGWAAAARAEWGLEDRSAGGRSTGERSTGGRSTGGRSTGERSGGRIAWDEVVLGSDDTERAALLNTTRGRERPALKCLTWDPPVLDHAAPDPDHATRGTPGTHPARAESDLRRYFAALGRRRRTAPEGDLISTLATASVDGDRLDDDDLADLGALLLTSAHGTTADRIAATAHTLLTHPADLAWLRHNPEHLPAALDALPPPTRRPRGPALAEADVELGGVLIRAGERVHVSALAGRPAAAPRPAPSWVGARLARMDLEVAIGALLPRLPGLRLAVDADQLPWRHGAPESLPVAWS
ncbi:cytochrome P450-like protein [Actinosynnema mirum]|uniref:Cytochrome P450-like protein n=1 Tax=Actinosynnema mirum (strain ATCC 29888 / DSM 43827 / JCM 3225 / NBRC 14064 / NCIMB 13271 / NRRL B-12336 / IMRU 3971 / 101) TaxID=446462 RepID=C6WL32_ACTMD|nr:cytochrome P450-like protein [Actinosynnema mirum]ACU36385.1 cytochrome P450-like protein [Actinosynnema mirum DSM 43827]